MLIVHGLFDQGTFAVWGECPADAKQPAPFSPFDAGWLRLRDVLAELLPDFVIPTKANTIDLWLPTVNGQPIPSSPLLAPPTPTTATPVLQCWRVMGLKLPAKATMNLLTRCVGRPTIQLGVIVGSTLAYWTQAMRFAGSLVYRDSYMPSLNKSGKNWQPTWQAVVVGDDAQRLAKLANAMPAAARAAGTSEQPPTVTPTEHLTSFIHVMVDALVRSAVPTTTMLQESIHDRWLVGLYGDQKRLKGTDDEWNQLAENIRDWSASIQKESASPFRLCFRLEEPPDANTPWTIRYLLQANDDPSLLIPVEEAWQPQAAVRQAFDQRQFSPREYLLSSLGQAAKISVPIDTSLNSARPASCSLDVAAAYTFLSETAWLLESTGFGVLLPSWWTSTKRRFTSAASVKSSMRVAGNLSLASLVNVEWHVMLGDQQVSIEELQQLARLKTPLVEFRGEWIHVNAEQIQAALASLKKQSKISVRELVHTSLGVTANESELEVTSVKATGWVGRLLDELREATFEEQAVPAEFHGELRPYQLRGYSWLTFLRRWGFGACLADDMGLGKTIQTLAMLQFAWNEEKRPALLVCPTSVLGNWQREAARFVPDLPVYLHHGTTRATGAAFTRTVKKTGLVLTSYGLFHRDADLLAKAKWSTCILDEAQNIKNPETKQAKTARTMPADFKVALTGTPVENHVGDLWSIMEFLNPNLLGTQAAFRRRFFVPIQAKKDPQAADRLKQITGPFILRRLKTDKSVIADLPDKIEMKVFCRLTKEQATLYAATVNKAQAEIHGAEGIQRKGMVLALLLRLKQLCNHPAQFLADGSPLGKRSGKLNRLAEMLDEIAETDEKVLLFSQFTDMGQRLQQFAQDLFGKEVLMLHGGTPRPARDEMVKRFQAPDGPRIFVLSLKAGGTGLNLTAANHVVHFDRWWNPAVENQATDRAFRIGQQRNVMVHKFVCTGTVEEKIDAMIEAKSEVAGKVVGTGENWLTELSDHDLHTVLTLSPDAVEE